MRCLRLALAQINVTVGDLEGNLAKAADFLRQARKGHADLVVFPELAIPGYPPEDLLFKPSFIQKNLQVLKKLTPLSRGLVAIVGFVDSLGEKSGRGRIANAAAVLAHGRWVARYHKMMLPNYGVFDEKRYFTPGQRPLVIHLDFRVGVSICEDIWVEEGPCGVEASSGASLLVNLSASPYHAGKRHERERMLTRRARQYRSWIAYVNLIGGQDELVFDGGSMLVNPQGKVVFRGPQFKEGLFFTEIPLPKTKGVGSTWHLSGPRRGSLPLSRSHPGLNLEEEVYEALVLGLKDYVQKNGFKRVVLGLSGGIDSALTAGIAVAALGKEAVTGVSMPSRFSSEGTQSDAKAVAEALGIQFLEIPIEPAFETMLSTLRPAFAGAAADVTEENLQARIRGTLLMALSNKFHWLVLATGNKSEISMGYCTLYGDMVGGFAVIKDLPKTWVYRIARIVNRRFGRDVIPASVFRRVPTAELRENQRDQDTLPPYPLLDRLIRAYVEQDLSAGRIRRTVKAPRQVIERVLRAIDLSEYKRRQAPIGIKITPRAFGKDRRVPITHRYREA